MGFFPVAGQDVYLLVAPFFREVRLRTRSPTGARAVIRVLNFDPTYAAKYIQTAALDGKPLHQELDHPRLLPQRRPAGAHRRHQRVVLGHRRRRYPAELLPSCNIRPESPALLLLLLFGLRRGTGFSRRQRPQGIV